MDLGYWGFRYWPFERTYLKDRIFFSPIQDEAMARLLFLVEDFHRTGIVIGPSGTGKTYILKLLQNRAERLGQVVKRVECTGLDSHELVKVIADGCLISFEHDASPSRVWSSLQARFAAQALIQQPLLIILDHFNPLDLGCVHCVNRLRQLADSIGLKLTIILGTNQLSIPLSLEDLLELRIEIAPWTETECSQFITRSIAAAGGSQPIYADDALRSIYEYTHGIPAAVVSLCNLTLLAAMGQSERWISGDFVDDVAIEMPNRMRPRRVHRNSSLMSSEVKTKL